MAKLRAPKQVNATVDLADLGAQWLRGLNTSHDAGCGCGGMFVPVLNARMIEEDFLDFLYARYEREKLFELASFVDARRKDETRGLGANSFERWIAALGDAEISEIDRRRLIADIRTFVESMGGGRKTPGICF